MRKIWTDRLTIASLALVASFLCFYIAADKLSAHTDYGTPQLSVSEAPYKAIDTTTDTVYYADAYGIEPDGALRIEVPALVSTVVEIDASGKPIRPDTTRLRMATGSWRLYDRITNQEIKPKGG